MRGTCLRNIYNVAVSLVLALAFALFSQTAFAASGSTDLLERAISDVGAQIQDGNVPDELTFDDKINALLESSSDRSISETAKEFNDYFSKCMVCTVFSIIFDSINELSYVVWERSKLGFTILLGVLLALWLAFKFGGAISSLVPLDIADFWRNIGIVLMKTIFAATILSFGIGDFIGAYIISPVVYGASSFTEVVVKSYTSVNPFASKLEGFETGSSGTLFETYSGSSNTLTGENRPVAFGGERKLAMEYADRLSTEELKELAVLIQNETDKNRKKQLQDLLMRSVLSNATSSKGLVSCSDGMTQHAEEAIAAAIQKEQELKRLAAVQATQSGQDYSALLTAGARVHGILNIGTKVAFMCMIDAMNRELAFGKGVGASLMKYGLTAWDAKIPYINVTVPLPDFTIIAAGALIWIACFILMVIFAFKLIDACFRLGVLSIIMPLLLIAFVFPSTKDYAKRGLTTLVQIVCIFIVMSVILALAVLLIMEAFQFGMPTITADNHERGLDVFTLYNQGKIAEMSQQMNLTTRSFLGALACIFFAIMSLGMVDSTASEFSGVQFRTTVGDKIGAMTTQGAMQVGQAGMRGVKFAAAKARNVNDWRKSTKQDKSGNDKSSSASKSGGSRYADEKAEDSKENGDNDKTYADENPNPSYSKTGDKDSAAGKSSGKDEFDVSPEAAAAFRSWSDNADKEISGVGSTGAGGNK